MILCHCIVRRRFAKGWPICSERVAYFAPKGRPVCSEKVADLVRKTQQGAKDLTIIANAGGVGLELSKRIKPEGYQDLGILFEKGQVKKFVGSMPALGGMPPTTPIEKACNQGEVEIEMVPQGTLAERIRAGADGLGGFYTPTGVGTMVEKGKEKRLINGKEYILELPLKSDFALIKAHKADILGNLIYHGTARAFNPVMAMAAKVTVAEVEKIVPLGELDPETIVTPHVYVKRIVEIVT